MRQLITLSLLAALLAIAACHADKAAVASATPVAERSIGEAFAGKFMVGAALNRGQYSGRDTRAVELVCRHFNTIVAENDMKCEKIHPHENRYDWRHADRFVEFGEQHGMHIVGHCLIWHSQCAPWFSRGADGKLVDAETLKRRMRDHIHAVVGRYRGRVHGWDVVNEAIVEDGSYRKSFFYRVLGEEFIPLAFQYAHEADPDAELYINDYGMNVPGRRDAYVRLVKSMRDRGLRVDAIGMQGHIGMDYPDFDEFEASLQAFAATGCKVMITELDMSALPTIHTGANISDIVDRKAGMNPYTKGLPDGVSNEWNDRMTEFFDILLRHSDDITRVNLWGVTDADSWKNNWPMRGRTDYPLAFDRNYRMKPFMQRLCASL